LGHGSAVQSHRLRRHLLGGSGIARPIIPRHRLIGHRRRFGSGGSRALSIALTVALAVVLVVGGTVGVLGVATVATVGALSTGLPDPARLAELTFSQPSVVFDRTGDVELARFQREQRRVVAFDEVPRLILDATTTAEDRTFWENDGYDPAAIVQAIGENVSGESGRGGSTITQQLVRARLLPDDVVAPGADRYIRKAKEIIQAARLTEAFPGEEGKQAIITAYLNEIFYGHDAYGIAAAARIYFGVSDLKKLTPAQAALLASLPKSPTSLDPYQFAEKDAEGRWVVDKDAPPVVRRNYVLNNLATSRWTKLSASKLKKALAEPVILAGDKPLRYRAPHFTWQVRRQLEQILGSREAIETGGYTVITTLDWKAQHLAERWLTAAAIAPNLPREQSDAYLVDQKIGRGDRSWINNLRGKDIHNGSLVALDYKTGDVLAYAGSAGYYREDLASKKFDPKYDAAGDGVRQPGSAWKPIVYATAFEERALTPGSLLLDITTEFGKGWAPRDADQLDRGPVLVRRALQYSLNIPAVRALERVGSEAVLRQAEALGIRFHGGPDAWLQSGLAGAIGTVEVRPIDLTAAYGAIANAGQYLAPRMILEVRGPDGKVVWKAPPAEVRPALSPEAAYLVADILAGNTDRRQNPIWAERLALANGPDGAYRPAGAKTGTANDALDLATYGFLAPPEDGTVPGLAVGVWMGNSDHSNPRTREPVNSIDAAAPLWRAFVRDYSRDWPVTDFHQPSGVTEARIDAWSGGRPGPWTRDTVTEFFIEGTQPGSAGAIDENGLLYARSCGRWAVHPLKAELGPADWDDDVADWMRRARRGPGVMGEHDSRTAYFWGERSWGGRIAGPCPAPEEREKPDKDNGGGDDKDKDKPGGPKPPDPPDPEDAPDEAGAALLMGSFGWPMFRVSG
jgi:membrane peptidoglycan carboxypeptidase